LSVGNIGRLGDLSLRHLLHQEGIGLAVDVVTTFDVDVITFGGGKPAHLGFVLPDTGIDVVEGCFRLNQHAVGILNQGILDVLHLGVDPLERGVLRIADGGHAGGFLDAELVQLEDEVGQEGIVDPHGRRGDDVVGFLVVLHVVAQVGVIFVLGFQFHPFLVEF